MTRVNRRAAVSALALAVMPLAARAQPARPARVAWLSPTRADSALDVMGLFRQGLRDTGLVEGRHLVIDPYWGDDSRERLEQQAAALLRTQPDLIVAHGPAAIALKRLGAALPVAFVFSGDPVEAGLVESLARPGRNMTGLSQLSPQFVGKRMEMLKLTLPALSRVAVIANTSHPGERIEWRASEQAARSLGLTLDYVGIAGPLEVEAALAAVQRARSEALVVFPDVGMMRHAELFAAFAQRHRIPAISGWAEFARRGNLMSYGPNSGVVYRRLAHYVDRLLKGARPVDLPVELPTVVELVINRGAARRLGLTLPQTILARADEVIE
jgi:putative tryptophan/tyrosine transport system substrate-binding protein